jgi:DNA-binding response OmpR family regulator
MENTDVVEEMRILVVEDDPAEAELVLEALREVDVAAKVDVVGDGVSALAFLHGEEPFSEREIPDFVLLDLNLPRKDGRAVLTDMKEHPVLRKIPVIVLSNSDSDEDIEHVYQNNGNCYVVKPPDMDGMYAFVESLKRFWGECVRYSPDLAP